MSYMCRGANKLFTRDRLRVCIVHDNLLRDVWNDLEMMAGQGSKKYAKWGLGSAAEILQRHQYRDKGQGLWR